MSFIPMNFKLKEMLKQIKYNRLSEETKYLINILNNSELYRDIKKSDFITVYDDKLFKVCYERMMIIAYSTEISWILDDEFGRDFDFKNFNTFDHAHMLDEKYIITAIESSKFNIFTIKILN